jgi:hypothetical protein
VPDEDVSLGEVQRNVDRIDKRLADFVTVDAWTRENDRHKERIAEVDKASRERDDDLERATAEQFKEIKERSQITRGQFLTLLGIVAGVVASLVAAYISTKGIK